MAAGRVYFPSKAEQSQNGAIRETVIIPGKGRSTDAALVEFRHAESVPAALTRDESEVDDHVIRVSLLWRSTLFVTNFPRDMDDDALKAMFSEVRPAWCIWIAMWRLNFSVWRGLTN